MWGDDDGAYERIKEDLRAAPAREDVALVVLNEDGTVGKTMAIFHGAAVVMERAEEPEELSMKPSHLILQTQSITQIRVTTSEPFTIFSEEYFSQKGLT